MGAMSVSRGPLEWSIASRALVEGECGDAAVVVPCRAGVLLAVIDGLGHGPDAKHAAALAAGVLNAHTDESVVRLLERCHAGLRATRGAVMSVVSLHTQARSLTWGGIGNVEGVLLRAGRTRERAREYLPLRGGIVGYGVAPTLLSRSLALSPGDTLVLATDGIAPDFVEHLALEHSPRLLADEILGEWGRANDDALVLVARYSEEAPGADGLS
jgi:phosphoserine phosphatase RsbX